MARTANNSQKKPPTTGWFWIEDTVVDRIPEIGIPAFVVYAAMAKYTDDERSCFPSIRTLARTCKMGHATILRAVETLDRADLIVVKRSESKNGSFRPNVYTLPPLAPGVITETPPVPHTPG